MGFFSDLPGNPLTPDGLRKRIVNASSSGKSLATALPNFVNSLPGNPLTPEGLRKRISNQPDNAPVSAKTEIDTKRPYPSPASVVTPPSQPQAADTLDYLDAPWASAYGMSKETAYSEAMENTAYRRSVQDMQKAGLNPAVIFGAGNGYTAGSPAYVRSTTSGSGSGSDSGPRSGSGRGRSKGKLFSTSAYSVMSALGGIVGAAATRTAGGYWLGTSLAQGAMNALNLLSKR